VLIKENRTHEVKKVDKLIVGDELVIDVKNQITIRTGKSEIVMKKNGDITINGKNITVNGSGKIVLDAEKDIFIKGKTSGDN
jgi:type VI secretion system secreted protein VgrG